MHPDHWRRGSGLLVLSLLLGSPVLAQQEDAELRKEVEELKKGQQALQIQLRLIQEVEALKKGQEEIRKELADIKQLLGQRPAAPARAAAAPDVSDVVLNVAGKPSRGKATAPLTLVEFTDYQ